MPDLLSYNEALSAVISGQRATRVAWENRDRFIFWVSPKGVPEFSFDKTFNTCSLSFQVRKYFLNLKRKINISGFLSVYSGSGKIFLGWHASPSDLSAIDWFILPEIE